MWSKEPKTQTRPSSPDAGPVRPAACAPRAAPPCTHTDTHGISATQPTVWGVRTDAASAATAPLDLGHKLRAYALEMGIPRGQCPLGHHGTTHRAQAQGKAEAAHRARICCDGLHRCDRIRCHAHGHRHCRAASSSPQPPEPEPHRTQCRKLATQLARRRRRRCYRSLLPASCAQRTPMRRRTEHW